MSPIVIKRKDKIMLVPLWPLIIALIVALIVTVYFTLPYLPSFSMSSYNDAYLEMYNAVVNNEKTVKVKKPQTDVAWRNACYRITEGTPDFFHVDSLSYIEQGDYYTVKFDYNANAYGYEEKLADFRSRIEQTVAAIPDGYDDYAKARWLNDWITAKFFYDGSSVIHDAYSMLVQGKGVCSAYAQLYKALLDAAGIPNVTVYGVAGGGNHAWNVVRIKGIWYHVDVTWNDSDKEEDRYRYFLVSDVYMKYNGHSSWKAVNNHAYWCAFNHANSGKPYYSENDVPIKDNSLYKSYT